MRLCIKWNDLLSMKLEIELSHIELHLAEVSEETILVAEKLENQHRKPDVEPNWNQTIDSFLEDECVASPLHSLLVKYETLN